VLVVKRFLLFLLLGLFTAWAGATPKIDTWTLDNGIGVYFVESHDLPILQVKVIIDAGSVRDPKELKGIASITAGMLEEGTKKRDADAIAEAFEEIGAQYSASANRDMTVMSLRTLSEKRYVDPALDIFREVLLTPVFPEASLQRDQKRVLISLQRSEQSPGAIASKIFFQQLYGKHPYASRPVGTVEGVRKITTKALIDFYRRYYVGANTKIAIVGDVTAKQARRLAKELAGALPRGNKAAALPPVKDLKSAINKHISFPSTQTHIRVGQKGMYRKDPDYFPLYVGNYILGGGGLVSRLTEEIREKQGLAYSVYSYFSPLRVHGPFTMGMQTQYTQRHKALTLLRKQLQDFINDGPSEKELVAAKKHLTGGFPLRIDSNSKIAGYLTVIGFYDLPLDYLDQFNERIESVTRAQIKDAFQRRIQPDKMVVVTVGDGR